MKDRLKTQKLANLHKSQPKQPRLIAKTCPRKTIERCNPPSRKFELATEEINYLVDWFSASGPKVIPDPGIRQEGLARLIR